MSLTRSHKRTSMEPCRSCWNGTTSALQLEEITSKGTSTPHQKKKSGNLFNDPRKYIYRSTTSQILTIRRRSTTSQISTIRRILEGVRAKNLQATLIFVDFTKAFDSIHRGKMEQILLAYGIPEETVAAITILYRNTKVKVRSPDGDTEYFDIVAGVLQGDTLAPYLFIICLDYVLRTSIDKIRENGFELTKKKKQKVPRKNNYRRRLRR